MRFRQTSIYIIVFVGFMSFHSNGQYPPVIDSIVVNYKGTSQFVIIDNHLDERQEYEFDQNGKLIADNYFALFEPLYDSISMMPTYVIDSSNYFGDSVSTRTMEYQIDRKGISYSLTRIEYDTLRVYARAHYYYSNGDTIFWATGSNNYQVHHSLIDINDKYIAYFEKYTFWSDSLKTNRWNVFYDGEDVLFIEEKYHNAVVLHFKKNVPHRISKYNLSSYRNVDNYEAYFRSNYKSIDPTISYSITYCESDICEKNLISSDKLISKFITINHLDE